MITPYKHPQKLSSITYIYNIHIKVNFNHMVSPTTYLHGCRDELVDRQTYKRTETVWSTITTYWMGSKVNWYLFSFRFFLKPQLPCSNLRLFQHFLRSTINKNNPSEKPVQLKGRLFCSSVIHSMHIFRCNLYV